MARSTRPLAKLTRPRPNAAVRRERLFHLMDKKRDYACLWIAGPSGAGKSTLAATYLDKVDRPAIWYQIDNGDADPSTFFFYLREAARHVVRKRGSLPLFTPEYRDDVEGFSRRFFRNLFLRLPPGALIVFDNQHEVPSDSPLHAD